jgi:hypothetical protein
MVNRLISCGTMNVKYSILPWHSHSGYLQTCGALICLLFWQYFTEPPIAHIFVPVYFALPLLIPALRQKAAYWLPGLLPVVYFYLVKNITFLVINHKHMMAYLYLIWVVSFWWKPERCRTIVLSVLARRLIAICFILAVYGKFSSPQFLNGSFMQQQMLWDGRLKDNTRLIFNLSKEQAAHNERVFAELYNKNIHHPVEAGLIIPKGLPQVAFGLSVWTIFIESLVALCFLSSRLTIFFRFRHLVLLAFIATTYPIATVPGFAMVLAVLGFMEAFSARQNKRVWTTCFAHTALLVPLFLLTLKDFGFLLSRFY